MKVSVCVAIDEQVDSVLNQFCKKVICDVSYKRSKSEVVNEALKEYLVNHGMTL
jgi:hypothetical protein